MSLEMEEAYRKKYGVDWYECLSEAVNVNSLPARDVLSLVVKRMIRLAESGVKP